jgi:UDP-N-acetylmuramoylalanine--D-glutamate ligase
MSSGVQLEGRKVLVIGLARTGVATAVFCASRNAVVSATDVRDAQQFGDGLERLRSLGIRLVLGEPSSSLLQGQDLIVPSPGVPADAPILQQARAQNIPIWSEIEVAYRFLRGRLIGITGSNGKTTTTSLVEHTLRGAGFSTVLAGNIGTPLIAKIDETTDKTVTVAELSSFQLELTDRFRPNVAVFLNLTPDHLDRHQTLDAYGAAKARIFANQTREDAAVVNADDPASLAYTPKHLHVIRFSRKSEVVPGAFVRDGKILFAHHGEEERIIAVNQIPLPGAHNLENVLAAVAATRLVGARPAQIEAGIKSFPGVEHRIEFVTEIRGVRYYNDSKATNVDATLKALQSFPGRILVILGGKDKHSDYTLLRDSLRTKGVLALLIGAAAQKIEKQIEGSVALQQAGTLENAVEAAFQAAHAGDIVLLSPACASFDQFQNFEHRGRVFKELVRQLEGAKRRSEEIPGNPESAEKRHA